MKISPLAVWMLCMTLGACSCDQAPSDTGDGDVADAASDATADASDGADAGIPCETAAECEDDNPCTTDVCGAEGVCTPVALGSDVACDDGSACTQVDACQDGVCVGGDPVLCAALDQCHDVGVCDPETGVCSDPALPDTTACDDGDGCTQTDTCTSGACVGSNPVVCAALDQCHVAGACDPGTGMCSNPNAMDTTACDDDDACTQSDACAAGECVGSNPVLCAALDQCHVVGMCDPGTGVCSNPNAMDTTACDDDDACTQSDACASGACVGSNPVLCTALDQCHVAGTCDPGTGTCSNPNAMDTTACDDENACTQADSCQGGGCVGASPIVCTPIDECHVAGVCDTNSGACSTPAADFATSCNAGLGYCDSGVCTEIVHGMAMFEFTGAAQTFVVPPGVISLNIEAFGAQGNANAGGIVGGLGGSASGSLSVVPGTVLTIYVGSGGVTGTAGGFNGGGDAGTGPTCVGAVGGGGGGASDVRLGAGGLADRVLVAAGGGGAGGQRVGACGRGSGGGGGGGLYGGGGGAAWPRDSVVVPTGGSQVSGGLGGESEYTSISNNDGFAGVLGAGGAGGEETGTNQAGSGTGTSGGVGGGTVGGDGTYAGNFVGQSGAGGSSYTGGVTSGGTSSGVRSGAGLVVISY